MAEWPPPVQNFLVIPAAVYLFILLILYSLYLFLSFKLFLFSRDPSKFERCSPIYFYTSGH